MDNFLAEIRIFPYTRIPDGWVPCNGQVMQINTNQALYSLLGTFFGGDAKTTFNLPNLNGRAILGMGRSTVPNNLYTLGNNGGAESVKLTISNIPYHTHYVMVNNSYDIFPPGTNFLGNPNTQTSTSQPQKNTANANLYNNGSNTGKITQLPANAVSTEGGNQPHENRMPYLPLIYCIAVKGLYPTRD